MDGAQATAEDGLDEAQKVAGEAIDEAGDVAEAPQLYGLPQPAEGFQESLDLSVLRGLGVTEDRTVYDNECNQIGQLAEGDAEVLAGYPTSDNGEILDEDGDLVVHVELLPDAIKKQLQEARDQGEGLPEGAN